MPTFVRVYKDPPLEPITLSRRLEHWLSNVPARSSGVLLIRAYACTLYHPLLGFLEAFIHMGMSSGWPGIAERRCITA